VTINGRYLKYRWHPCHLIGRPPHDLESPHLTTTNAEGMAKTIDAYRRKGRYISPFVDNTARVMFALAGGIFLLAPMIIMAYVESKRYLVITTVVFVFLAAIALALSSKASNQELLTATAAYAAVLVVFVGNTIRSVDK
jgi:VIT1/CCC1 family predicted Fe2+/Mn2+ transporter